MIKPLGKRVLIKQIDEKEISENGIILTTMTKEKSNIGKVVQIGDDVDKVNIDDKVIFQNYAGSNIKYLGEEYLIFNEDEILAVIK